MTQQTAPADAPLGPNSKKKSKRKVSQVAAVATAPLLEGDELVSDAAAGPSSAAGEGPQPSKAARKKRVKKSAQSAVVHDADESTNFDSRDIPQWSWTPLVSERHTCPAVFSKDGQYFFLPDAFSIRIYSTRTLRAVSTLSSRRLAHTAPLTSAAGHTNFVTAIALNPNNSFQLYSASLDGTIKIWDWLEGALLKTINCDEGITHLCAHADVPDTIFIATTTGPRPDSNKTARIKAVDVRSGSLTPVGKRVNPISGLAIAPSGRWVVAISSNTVLISPTSGIFKTCKFINNERLTCLAFHPTDDYFATGDTNGIVQVWYCLNDEQVSFKGLRAEKKATTSSFHWHSHAVGAVAFTPDGSYVLSGGVEAVMVLHQLESGHKGFLPRVGSEIHGITPVELAGEGQRILLCLADGDLAMFDANMQRIETRSDRLKFALDSTPFLAVDPSRKWLALPSSHPASLQIYSPYASTCLQDLEVAPSNRVAHNEKQQLLTPASISHAAFGGNGRWLATVDERESSWDTGSTVHLKLWEHDPHTHFSLNTRIDNPHGVEGVVAIEFNNGENAPLSLATAGRDGDVKIWGTRNVTNREGNAEATWVKRTSLRYRDEIPTHLSFSPDGSILAVAQGRFVTLYGTRVFALLQVISTIPFPSLSSLAFVGYAGRYLAVSDSHGDLVLWDLVRSRVSDQISRPTELPPKPLTRSFIVPQPKSNTFAVLNSTEQTTVVTVHDVLQSKTLRTHSLPIALKHVRTLTAPSADAFTLVAIDHRHNPSIIGDDASLPEEEGEVEQSLSRREQTRLSLFEDVFGRSAFRNLEEAPVEVSTAEDQLGVGIDTRLLDGPAHLLPPMETLYTSLMNGLLLKRNAEKEDKNEVNDHEDGGMEVDEKEDEVVQEPRPLPFRTIGPEEMTMLVDLFTEHSLITHSTTAKGHKPNGVPLINGANHQPPQPNGHVSKRKTKPPKQLPSPSPSLTQSSIASPKTMVPLPNVGQKRKTPHPDL